MKTTLLVPSRDAGGECPRFVAHASFRSRSAALRYDPAAALQRGDDTESYMPDDVTRDFAKRMHYAAHRWMQARSRKMARVWRQYYFELRNRIVVGNQKLVYRAVSQRFAGTPLADDMRAECTVVLIRAVAAYNPWLGIRFSTYAFTCFLRALSRLGRRLANDRLRAALSLEHIYDAQLVQRDDAQVGAAMLPDVDQYLMDDNPLLTAREKTVLRTRYAPEPEAFSPTLENVGRALGLSKERVRQLQASALEKLRRALGEPLGAV